jgi:hypothetical protein
MQKHLEQNANKVSWHSFCSWVVTPCGCGRCCQHFSGPCYLHFQADTWTLKMEAACTSKTLAISPTSTRCNNPRTELISTINHHESLKSIKQCFSFSLKIPVIVSYSAIQGNHSTLLTLPAMELKLYLFLFYLEISSQYICKIWVATQQTTWRHIPEDDTLHSIFVIHQFMVWFWLQNWYTKLLFICF